MVQPWSNTTGISPFGYPKSAAEVKSNRCALKDQRLGVMGASMVHSVSENAMYHDTSFSIPREVLFGGFWRMSWQ